ncbi:MAG: hypothetical protein IKC97_04415 [Clostridia bacterium]|nr:hypothetical protein [Clostridia bacterium]
MSTATMKTATTELLQRLYKNLKMGSDSIVSLLPKVKEEDAAFKSDLTMQLDGYEKYAHRVNDLLRQDGEPSEQDNLWNKMTAKVGTTMSTLMDTTLSHLADMVIQGSTMNMNDTIKLMREFENSSATESALSLSRDIIGFEEQNIERMKAYL